MQSNKERLVFPAKLWIDSTFVWKPTRQDKSIAKDDIKLTDKDSWLTMKV